MFIVPPLVLLFTFVFWRPQILVEALESISIFHMAALCFFGYLLDARIGVVRPRGSALLGLLAALAVWSLTTVAIKAPSFLGGEVGRFGVVLFFFFLVSEGVQSLRALGSLIGVLLIFTIGLSAFGVHQGLSPGACFARPDSGGDPAEIARIESRSCEKTEDCYVDAPAGTGFLCEHVGLLGTHSIFGRVRYLGILEDPNELAWVLSMGLPLAFGYWEQKRSAFRGLVVVATLGLAGTCTIMTQSRGGQMAMLATVGVYFVRRYRARGLITGLVLGLPVLLLGGRSGEGAESSSQERLECWSEALSMFRESPLLGVGAGQFTEHHTLTAHNSFLLTIAELGPLGLALWTLAIYFAFKITVRIQVELADREDAVEARVWAMALLASMAGLTVSAFFLSIAYHMALWLYLALPAALYAAVRRHEPSFSVRLTWRDIGFVLGSDAILIGAIAVYLRLKGV